MKQKIVVYEYPQLFWLTEELWRHGVLIATRRTFFVSTVT
jgi:hypothetical protein